MDNILKKYKDIKEEIAQLEQQKKELEEIAISVLQPLGGSAQTPFGLFTIVTTRNWKYSEKVDSLKQLISLEKEREELNGIARLVKTSQHVRIVEIK